MSDNPASKATWPAIFKSAYDEALTPGNTTSCFRACGVFPFNKDTLPTDALMSSQSFKTAQATPSAPEALVHPSAPVPPSALSEVLQLPLDVVGEVPSDAEVVTSATHDKAIKAVRCTYGSSVTRMG